MKMANDTLIVDAADKQKSNKMSPTDEKAALKKGFFSFPTKTEKLEAEFNCLTEKERRKQVEMETIQSSINDIIANLGSDPKNLKALQTDLKSQMKKVDKVVPSLQRVKLDLQKLRPSFYAEIDRLSKKEKTMLDEKETIQSSINSINTKIGNINPKHIEAPQKDLKSQMKKMDEVVSSLQIVKQNQEKMRPLLYAEINYLSEDERRELDEKETIQSSINNINTKIGSNPKNVKALEKDLKSQMKKIDKVESSLKRIKLNQEKLRHLTNAPVQNASSDDASVLAADERTSNTMSVNAGVDTIITSEKSASVDYQMEEITTHEKAISPVTADESLVDTQQNSQISEDRKKIGKKRIWTTMPEKEDKVYSRLSQLNHKILEYPDLDNTALAFVGRKFAFELEEEGFRQTVKNEDFKVYPVIVRVNGLEKKVLALEVIDATSEEAIFSKELCQELNLTNDNMVSSSITISSLDDQQTIPVTKILPVTSILPNNERSYAHNEAERLWPHLFGPGQLSREEETVHVRLTRGMADALECSALTTVELCKLLRNELECSNYSFPKDRFFPLTPPDRSGNTSDPKKDYYWLMDVHTYNSTKYCTARRDDIFRKYNDRMLKRSNFIKSKEYLEIAEKKVEKKSFWWNLFCGCLPRKRYAK